MNPIIADKILEHLIDVPRHLTDEQISKALNIDKGTVREHIIAINLEFPGHMFLKKWDYGDTSTYIQSESIGFVSKFLKGGGFSKIAETQLGDKHRDEKRLRLEEENWIATTEQAKKAVKQSRWANWISLLSLLVAIGSLIIAFFK